SRRRHTRCLSDWSSDVCSSDLPSATESPEVECIIVESVDPEGPFGAKEASEGSLAATIPAIANAIYDAVGVRLREAPFTPERVRSEERRVGKEGRGGGGVYQRT